MAKYNIEITLVDNTVNKIIEADDELQAMDKIYEMVVKITYLKNYLVNQL